jgi:hypothetical protein
MDATQVIHALLKAGFHAKHALEEARSRDPDFDWGKFVASKDFTAVAKDVEATLQGMTQSDVAKAVARIRKKQAALLAGRPISGLSFDELMQFGQLADAAGILVRKEIQQLGANANFISWLVDEALPVLRTVAQVVLPIIL